MTQILIALVIALIILPPSWDPSIRIKEFQMGQKPPPDGKFWKSFRNAIFPDHSPLGCGRLCHLAHH